VCWPKNSSGQNGGAKAPDVGGHGATWIDVGLALEPLARLEQVVVETMLSPVTRVWFQYLF
jgi:hypothetical protein